METSHKVLPQTFEACAVPNTVSPSIPQSENRPKLIRGASDSVQKLQIRRRESSTERKEKEGNPAVFKEENPSETGFLAEKRNVPMRESKKAEDSSDSGEELVPVKKSGFPLKIHSKRTSSIPVLPNLEDLDLEISPKTQMKDNYDSYSVEEYWLRKDEIEDRNARRRLAKKEANLLNSQREKEKIGQVVEEEKGLKTQIHDLGPSEWKPRQLLQTSKKSDDQIVKQSQERETMREAHISKTARLDTEKHVSTEAETVPTSPGFGKSPLSSPTGHSLPSINELGSKNTVRSLPEFTRPGIKWRSGDLLEPIDSDHRIEKPLFEPEIMRPLVSQGTTLRPKVKKPRTRAVKKRIVIDVLLSINRPDDLAGAYMTQSVKQLRPLKSAWNKSKPWRWS